MILGIWPTWWHTLFEWLAYFTGGRLLQLQRKADVISSGNRNWVIAACIIGAAIGSKVVVWLDNPDWFFQHPIQQPENWPLLLTSGKGIGGALVGGLAGVELFKAALGIRQATGDLFVTPLIAAIIIGRIGCFLSGYYDHTYGVATTLPWGVDFGDGVLRHPTQLYEIIFLAVLLGLIHWRSQRPYPAGLMFRYFMIGYFFFRFWIEFIKPVPHAFFGINGTQILSVMVLMYYAKTIQRMSQHTVRFLLNPIQKDAS